MTGPVAVYCPACRQPLRIHCGSLTCTWFQCATPACIWTLYAPRQRKRKDRNGVVWTYDPGPVPPPLPPVAPPEETR